MDSFWNDVAISRSSVFSLLFVWVALLSWPAGADDSSAARGSRQEVEQSGKPVIYLNIEATTYRTRGRVSFGIAATLKSKLAAYGYAVTLQDDSPHDLTLAIRYRETRGQQITLDLYGTDIACAVTLSDPSEDRLLNLAMRESPDYAGMMTAPYIEVVDKLQANPYFYFLPDLIHARTEFRLDATAGLITALERVLYSKKPVASPWDTLVSPAETFSDLDDHFSSAAARRTIQKLGWLQDHRATDLLLKLTSHPNHVVRLEAVRALEGFSVPAVAAVIARVAEQDTHVTVREAAKAVLTRLPMP